MNLENGNLVVAQPEPNLEQAGVYIGALTGRKDAAVTFQTIPDAGPASGYAAVFHGTLARLADELVRRNRHGQGVYLMVNAGDGMGRSARNVTGLRALFTDDDGDGPHPSPSTDAAPPTIEVQSKRGVHRYWLLEPGEPLTAFTPAQDALRRHFGTDPKVKDLPRVMRVPGFLHQKDPAHPFLVRLQEVRKVRYTIQRLLDALGIDNHSEVRARPEVQVSSRSAATASSYTTGTFSKSRAARRASAYISKIPGAVEGQGGDALTFKVACILIRDFALPFETAMAVFKNWNVTCQPRWPDEDLAVKLRRAMRYGDKARGRLLTAST